MKFSVIRYEGAKQFVDVWSEEAQATFVTEDNGALTIRAAGVIACVYGPGHWLLVRRVEPTA